MKKLMMVFLLGVCGLFAACDFADDAGAVITELKNSGHDKFTLIGKKAREGKEYLYFANDTGITLSCRNLQLDFSTLVPSVDGTGSMFRLQFRGEMKYVQCYSMKAFDGKVTNDEYKTAYFDLVPINKN